VRENLQALHIYEPAQLRMISGLATWTARGRVKDLGAWPNHSMEQLKVGCWNIKTSEMWVPLAWPTNTDITPTITLLFDAMQLCSKRDYCE
jgi:hypothetical protein